jgi:hypothetical protein
MLCNEACQCFFFSLQVTALLALAIVSAMADEKREKRHFRLGGWNGGWGGFADYGYGYDGLGYRPHYSLVHHYPVGHGFRPNYPVGHGFRPHFSAGFGYFV